MTVLCDDCVRGSIYEHVEQLCIGGHKSPTCHACGYSFNKPLEQANHYNDTAETMVRCSKEALRKIRGEGPQVVQWRDARDPTIDELTSLIAKLQDQRELLESNTRLPEERTEAPHQSSRTTALGIPGIEQFAKSLEKMVHDATTLENLTALIAQLQDQVSHFQKRVCELLESNTRLLEERRAVDVHYNVEQFHRAAGFDDPRVPCVPPDPIVRYRMRTISEEFVELLEATYDREHEWNDRPAIERIRSLLKWVIDEAPVKVDLPAFIDATVDIDYFVEGTRQQFGVDGRPILVAVQRANMAKFGPGMERRADGKVGKPPGWEPPDVAGELCKQGWRG